MRKLLLAAVLLLAVFPSLAWASFEEAEAAYDRGDHAAAFAALQGLAQQADPRSQSLLGLMYARGHGAERNFTEANRWFMAAADQGDVVGQYGLGLSYLGGNGIAKDEAKAVPLLRAAAEKGHKHAAYFYAYCMLSGRGTTQDAYNGMNWLNEARRRGSDEAVNLLRRFLAPQSGSNAALYQGGFGDDFDTAVEIRGVDNTIDGVRAEYSYLNIIYPGWRRTSQALLSGTDNHVGKKFDRLDIVDRDGQNPRSVYFEITPWFGKFGTKQ
ncbi:tetratricopeptide repeat protein [Ferrovibrio sp.]|uniref:tetratricopeptide repeat protein n=1 Tax=Ferrovibrio sp. TaxID=1917215 RepID=UPI003D286DBB